MIDFHTHMFPEKIAPKTLHFLSERCKTVPFTDGTPQGLAASAEEAGLECSVALPVVTNPEQFDSINRFAEQYRDGRILSFGGIHPENEDYKKKLLYLKDHGFPGIKLHPDFHVTFFYDIRYKRIISFASELDLIVSVHAGFDPGYPDRVHCTPAMAAEMLEEVQPTRLVLAHMGGNELWDETERFLVGQNVYFDTGVVLGRMPKEQFIRMVRSHGADKILFATDSPWGGQKEFVEILSDMPLTSEEMELIFSGNARRLLDF